MNRRGFFGKLIKGAAVVAVAPMVIAAVVPTPVQSKVFAGEFTGKFMSVRVGGRTFHYVKGINDAMMKHKMDMEHALLFGDMKFCTPSKTGGVVEYLNFKT